MRPTRAAAENTPAKPGQQPSFSQSATVPLEPEPRRHPVTPARDARKEGSLMRPARAAAENKNTTRSSSAPKKKLSGASLFLAEMVRRRMVSESELNIT